MNYEIVKTVRSRDCDQNAPIIKLVFAQEYKGFRVHDLEDVKPLADQESLYVRCQRTHRSVLVRIFYSSRYSRWVATTDADNVECNNLLSLPISRPSRRDETTTYYESCSI